MRTARSTTLRTLRSRPISAAVARSDRGLAIVEANTSDKPIDTKIAITNICKTAFRPYECVNLTGGGCNGDPKNISINLNRCCDSEERIARRIAPRAADCLAL